MILNSELGLDKNRYDRRHRHTLREEKAQEAVGSVCLGELWGLLSSHMLEPHLTSESSEKRTGH